MTHKIKLIIGLGNPGQSYYLHRHSIGFRILDALAQRSGASWQKKNNMEIAAIERSDSPVFLVKPQTFMNTSGAVIPFFKNKGIIPEELLVVHDELELPFEKISFKQGGSAKGHNGLKSIIASYGSDNFQRLRFGIGRPVVKEQVPEYVLQNFSENPAAIENAIEHAVAMIEEKFLS